MQYKISDIFQKPLCRCSIDSPSLREHVDDLVNEILAKEHGYIRSDFDEICFLIDSDGIYIFDSCIYEDKSLSHTNYNLDSIIRKEKNALLNRNKRRVDNVQDLLKDNSYRIFYNSRNLEHSFDEFLYQHLSDKYKKNFVLKTFNEYASDKVSFINKLFEMNKSRSIDYYYYKSWEYLSKDLNSLSSCSNVFIFIFMHYGALKEEHKNIINNLI